MNLTEKKTTDISEEYADIIKQFPICMCKDDFYRIAHISKRTAEYLLKKAIVPCEYTGKKTRCFKIRTADVIQYLIQREIEPEAFAVPEGWYRKQKILGPTLADKLTRIVEYDCDLFRQFIAEQLDAYNDLMSVCDVAAATGYGINRITQLCRTGRIKVFCVRGKYHIPKVTLVEYLATPKIYRRYTEINDAPRLAKEFLLAHQEHNT